jgi:hypothetical protein
MQKYITEIHSLRGQSLLYTFHKKSLVYSTPGRIHKAYIAVLWCRRRDLNPHASQHTPLKRTCLPVPPLRQVVVIIRAWLPCQWVLYNSLNRVSNKEQSPSLLHFVMSYAWSGAQLYSIIISRFIPRRSAKKLLLGLIILCHCPQREFSRHH